MSSVFAALANGREHPASKPGLASLLNILWKDEDERAAGSHVRKGELLCTVDSEDDSCCTPADSYSITVKMPKDVVLYI